YPLVMTSPGEAGERGESAYWQGETPPSVEAEEGVSQNAEQPGFEVRAGSELGRRSHRADVGVLDEILGVRGVPGEIVGDVIERTGIGEALMPKESPRGVPLLRLAFLIATCRLGREVPAGQAAPHAGPSGERVRLNPRRREQARGRRPSIGRSVGSPVGYHGNSQAR